MATLVLPANRRVRTETRRSSGLFITAAYTLLAFFLLGYHPYAEDGGIYSASIAARIDPSLFPLEHAWVTAHTAFALFVPAAAFLFNLLHLGLEGGLLVLQISGLFATIYAARAIARHCFASDQAAQFAMLAFAICAGLPVAGTSLYLIDPCVTARTLTTPLLLWSVYSLLQSRYLHTAIFVISAALLHPLMAFWGGLTLAFLVDWKSRRWLPLIAVPAAFFTLAAAVLARLPQDSPLVHTLALSRGYWFLSQWHWYEVFGAIAPCAILSLLCVQRRSSSVSHQTQRVVFACCCASATALGLALCFARTASHSSVIARCQPLRTLHLVFALFVILASGWIGRGLSLRRPKALTAAVIAVAAVSVFSMQLAVYPNSRHIELPGLASKNDWLNAFLWIRENTSADALFALDADYIASPGEDAQGFRAAALRSALPDRAKDGGIASVVPALAADWHTGVEAQTGLDGDHGPERIRKLRALGVTWIIAGPGSRFASVSELICPYRNRTIAVCQLPR